MSAKHAARPMPTLITNTRLAVDDCRWCDAAAGVDAHSAACPHGERYKQIQQLGGVPWPKGRPFLDRSDFIRVEDYASYLALNGFAAEAST